MRLEDFPDGKAPGKDPHRVNVPVDVELDAAIERGARIDRLGKGPWLRTLAIRELKAMGLWPPRTKKP